MSNAFWCGCIGSILTVQTKCKLSACRAGVYLQLMDVRTLFSKAHHARTRELPATFYNDTKRV